MSSQLPLFPSELAPLGQNAGFNSSHTTDGETEAREEEQPAEIVLAPLAFLFGFIHTLLIPCPTQFGSLHSRLNMGQEKSYLIVH